MQSLHSIKLLDALHTSIDPVALTELAVTQACATFWCPGITVMVGTVLRGMTVHTTKAFVYTVESRQSFSPLMASSMLSELTCVSCCPACSCIYRAEKKDATRLDSVTSSVPAFWLTTALQPLCRSASMVVSEMQVLIVTMHPERALASCCSCSRTPRHIQIVIHLENTSLPQV